MAWDAKRNCPIYPGTVLFAPPMSSERREVSITCLVLYNREGTAGSAIPEHIEQQPEEVFVRDPKRMRELLTARLRFRIEPRNNGEGTIMVARLPNSGRIVMVHRRDVEGIPLEEDVDCLLMEEGNFLFARPLTERERASDEAFALAVRGDEEVKRAERYVYVNSGGVEEMRDVFELLSSAKRKVTPTTPLDELRRAVVMKMAEVSPDRILGEYRKALGAEPDAAYVASVTSFSHVVQKAGEMAIKFVEAQEAKADESPDSAEPESAQGVEAAAETEEEVATGELDLTVDVDAPPAATKEPASPASSKKPSWLSEETLSALDGISDATAAEPAAPPPPPVRRRAGFPSLSSIVSGVASPAESAPFVEPEPVPAPTMAMEQEEEPLPASNPVPERQLRADLSPMRRKLIQNGNIQPREDDYEPVVE